MVDFTEKKHFEKDGIVLNLTVDEKKPDLLKIWFTPNKSKSKKIQHALVRIEFNLHEYCDVVIGRDDDRTKEDYTYKLIDSVIECKGNIAHVVDSLLDLGFITENIASDVIKYIEEQEDIVKKQSEKNGQNAEKKHLNTNGPTDSFELKLKF